MAQRKFVGNPRLELRVYVPKPYSSLGKEPAKRRWEGGTPEDMRTFYTALYHTHFFPATFSDVNSDRPAYTIYSFGTHIVRKCRC